MTMSPVIYCLVDAEPERYYNSKNVYAVNLSFECFSDNYADERIAKAAYELFLTLVQGPVQFAVYQINGAILDNPSVVQRQIPKSHGTTAPNELFQWLSGRDPGFKLTLSKDSKRFWTRTEPTESKELVAAETAGAGPLLRAAQAWNAPVGHRFGLTYVAWIDIDISTPHVVLPFFSNVEIPKTLTYSCKDTSCDLLHCYDDPNVLFGSNMASLSCRTAVIKKGHDELLGGRLTAEGYFNVNPNAIPLHRLLTAFEHRASGLMEVMPSLFSRGKVFDAAQAEEAAYEKLFQLKKANNKTLVPVALVWLAISGLLAALDNIIIALIKPISKFSEGEPLTPLVSAIEDELNKSNLGQSRQNILVALRSSLEQSPLIATLKSRRSRPLNASALRHVYGMKDKTSADATVETQLLMSLLEHSLPDGNQIRSYEISDELLKAISNTHPLDLLMRALTNIQIQLFEESGAESAIIRLFETAANNSSNGSVPELIKSYLSLTAIEPVSRAWTQYCSVLNGPFNGAEAVRRATSLEYLNAVYQYADLFQFRNGPTPQAVAEGVIHANYFHRRLVNFDGKLMFDSITVPLIYYSMPEIPQDGELSPYDLITNHLNRSYNATMNNLGDLAGEGKRFIPDLAPHPLPLQVAGDVTGQLFQEFLDDFNGVVIAIHRDDQPGFAHANLAELRWGNTAPGQKLPPLQVPFTLHPFLPTVNDGRGPAFFEYHGMPFADASLANVMADPTAEADKTKPTPTPFYLADVVDDLEGQIPKPGQLPLPRLAYGHNFKSFAFAVTNAGALPIRQRLNDDEPWLPNIPWESSKDVVASADYQRRTAIGELEISELQPTTVGLLAKDLQRLNRNLTDVVALSSDYPRVSVAADTNSIGTVDLYRESDGIGTIALAFGKEQTFKLSIADIQITGSAENVWLCIQKDPAPAPSPFEHRHPDYEIICEDIAPELSTKSLSLQFYSKLSVDMYEVVVSLIHDDDETHNSQLGILFISEGDLLWVRLALKAGANPASISFAAPECPKGSRPAPSLLLLAPKNELVWQPVQVTQPACFKISTPRVGYLDFQRWMANRTLRLQAIGDTQLADAFYTDLAALYAMRNVHPILGNLFDRLPDPAVTEIRFTLCETDRLWGSEDFLPHTATLRLEKSKGLFHSIATNFTENWKNEEKRKDAISTLIREIDDQFSFMVTINCVGEADLKVVNQYPFDLTDADQRVSKPEVFATVPEGSAAHFTIEAMVESSLFSPPRNQDETLPLAPIHSGLLQYASSSNSNHHAFHAASFCIETMVDAIPHWGGYADTINPQHQAIIDLAYRMVEFKSAASARRYDLVTSQQPLSDADRNAWRIYSHATVVSQRWLYSGRPLYRSLNPKKVAWGRKEGEKQPPVLDISLRLDDKEVSVLDFEDELFFDRSNINADSLPIKLDPLPASTLLQTIVWDAPSASYWRHRFTLKSRYAGALIVASRREVNAFPPIKRDERLAYTWTLRAAMFADLSRIQLTRPQLRALIPLTTTTAGDTPSVLAVLQEPPLAHGGLADRVSAELKTGFGYGFETRDFVEIRDARKEVGPDPTLTYSAMPSEVAMGLALIAEGPIGLTFDVPHAAAPVFANSMFSLTPTLLGESPMQALEEHFLGILMQRHLDPEWLPDQPPEPVLPGKVSEPGHDADRCWWIEVPLDQSADEGLISAGTTKEPILSLERDSGRPHSIRVSKVALDGVAGFSKHDTQLVSVPLGTESIAFLHQPVAPGQYGLSIFMPRGLPDITRGHSGTWQKVASIVWSPPKFAPNQGVALHADGEKQSRRILVPNNARVQASAASATTSLAWTRTNRDFANVTIGNKTRSNTDRALVSDLTAKYVAGKKQLSIHYDTELGPLHVTSSTEANPYPLHKHRHLAYVMTRLRDEPGRPVEEYVHCGLFNGTTSSLPENTSISGRLNVRLIEFETPAVILSGTMVEENMPHEYRRHLLDLVATGSNTQGHLKLIFRFVGIEASLPKKIIVHLEVLKPGQKPAVDNDLKSITVDPGTGPMRGIEIWLHPGQSTITSIDLNGEVTSLPLDNMVSELLNAKAGQFAESAGLALGIDSTSDAGECWCDVSMLHTSVAPADTGPLTHKDAMDLRWLFSRDTPNEMTLALQPDAMAVRTEAQARIVSVTPPIAVIVK